MNGDIVEVQFKRERKEYYLNKNNIELKIGNYVIVGVDRGEDLGKVIQKGLLAEKKSSIKKNKAWKNS